MIPGFVPSAFQPPSGPPPSGDPPTDWAKNDPHLNTSVLEYTYSGSEPASPDPTRATISMWVRMVSYREEGYFECGDFNTAGFGFIQNSAGWWAVWLRPGNVYQSTQFPNPNTWYHILCQLTQGSPPVIWINGVDQSASFGAMANLSAGDMPGRNGDNAVFGNNNHPTAQNVAAIDLFHCQYVDGQIRPVTDFRDTGGNPVAYEGDFGGRGFNMRFENAGNLGENSANSFDMTVSGNWTQQTSGGPP